MAGTYFQAGWFFAAKAYNSNKAAGHASSCAYFNCAFYKRMIVLIYYRTNAHTREAAKAFSHFLWLKDFRHRSPFDVSYFIFIRILQNTQLDSYSEFAVFYAVCNGSIYAN